jgi:hypothetical protein
MYSRYFLAALILTAFFAQSCSEKKMNEEVSAVKEHKTLFTLLPSAQTNIVFSNDLKEGLNTNILMYEYFYNGGGVAAGDFNGDGWIDLYFVSNMEANKFFLNKGSFQFTEIGNVSGAAGRNGPWKTGVTLVDINGDNKLDIYLCYSGAMPEQKRINQLFINQGNDKEGIPHFVDKANEYGLASAGYSNQGYFFDYDKDGDLDMILLNHNPKSLPVLNEVSTAEFLKKDDPFMGTRLFKQDKGHFTDVTKKAGISGSALSYGLGVGIADFNNDGWSDFYLSNDYNVPDYLYINQHDGTFKDLLHQSIGHNSQFSMGNDVADINNDGLPDIVTLDMLPEDNHRQKLLLAPDNYGKFELNLRTGFHYQYMRNMLQLNNGNGTFSEVGQLAGISNTDWSWSALLADYNNDGWKDLFITNGYFRDYTNLDFIKYMNGVVEAKGRLKREDVVEIINHMPSSNVVNYIFSNQNGLQFSNTTREWGLYKPSNSNGATYADMDNDGDLDLIVNNINQPTFIYRNNADQDSVNNFLQIKLQGEGLNTQGIGASVTIFQKDKRQVLQQQSSHGYLSAVSPVLHFGLGNENNIDSLVIVWNNNKQETIKNVKGNQLITLQEANARLVKKRNLGIHSLFEEVTSPINHKDIAPDVNDFNRQPLLPYQLSFSGPCLAKADVNGDGKEDVFVGGGSNQAATLYIQAGSGSFLKKSIQAFEGDKIFVDADAAFFDADHDGDVDLYVASGGYHAINSNDELLQDRLYLNDGKGNFQCKKVALPTMLSSKSCVRVSDINQDGNPDLFVGARVMPGRYPEAPQSFILINDGKGKFSDQTKTIAPALERLGMITDATWVDINHDQQEDLIVVGEWLPVSVWINKNGKLVNETQNYFGKEQRGFWNKISVGDVNEDGKPDFIVGNYGTNTQCKVSDSQPAELFFKDFDNNGSIDPIFCFYIQGKSYPFVTRDELLEQQGRFRKRFNNYASYADITVTEIFTTEELKSAQHLSANNLSTTLFLSTDDNRYMVTQLPIEAQYAPVFTVTLLDYDKDGHQDLLLGGNISKMKVRIGKMDANYGMLMKGDGRGNFKYIPQLESGFKLQGDVRSVMELNGNLIFGLTGQSLKAYKIQ